MAISADKLDMLKVINFFILIVLSVHAHAADVAASSAEPSCQCEKLACDVCEREDGVEFFVAKCGDDLSKVKSCKRPRCVPVDNQIKCLALFQKKSEMTTPSNKTAVPVEAPTAVARALPINDIVSSKVAGQIESLDGAVRIYHAGSGVEVAHENSKVFVGDRFETLADAKVRILLRDQSEITLAPLSALKLTTVDIDEKGLNRHVMMDLEHGKVRNHVFKLLTAGSTYEVRTKNVIASVHGTDFVTTFDADPTEWTSRVETFDGVVRLERLSSKGYSLFDGQYVEIAAGGTAVFSAAPRSGDEADEMYSARLAKTRLGVPTKLAPSSALAVRTDVTFNADHVAEVSSKREPASAKDAELICSAPAGAFNQCSFTCQGNPKGQKTCRTDLQGVSCVRKLCNANGLWAEETRMPASNSSECDPQTAAVHACGSYW